jgi:hypothetical protein
MRKILSNVPRIEAYLTILKNRRPATVQDVYSVALIRAGGSGVDRELLFGHG